MRSRILVLSLVTVVVATTVAFSYRLRR